MKNDYEIRGGLTAIFIVRRDGTRVETLIDTSDLEIAKSFSNTWCVKFDTHTNSFYVTGMMKKPDGSKTTIRLHRLILNAPEDMVVDHINHETLDNTRKNLRVITNQQNQQNKRIYRNNTKSGVMGVTFHKHSNKWRVLLKVDGKTHYLGYYDDLKLAEKVSIEARRKLMPYSNV
ncbi:HNH endonuclease [Cytobacillus firmus]